MYYSMNDYTLIGFEKSKEKNKKYSAIIEHKKTKKKVRLNFGQLPYQQYMDSTPLKLYSHLDHNDEKRRKNYQARHKVYLKDGYFSPSYFSYNYLW